MRECAHDSSCRSSGFTLTELAVATSLVAVLVAMSYLALNSVGAMSNRISAREQATSTSRIAIDRMTREIRQAADLNSGSSAFQINRPNKIQFFVDVDRNGVPERVTYYLQSNALYRVQASATSSQPTAANYSADSTPEVVISSVDPAWNQAMFTYWSAGTTVSPTPSVVTSANPDLVGAVEIDLVALGKSADVTAAVTSEVMVRVRAVDNAILWGQ
jgi:prepilin-type N-terminal cleavage/methylation domain-containing protein